MDEGKDNLLRDFMTDTLLDLKNINKHFGRFQALKDINLSLKQGEVHCLVGENGCGKSTLIKILSGVYASDKGADIHLAGQPVRSKMTPKLAKAAGIHVIWQDLSLFPDLTVGDNIGFNSFVERPWRRAAKQVLYAQATASLARLGTNINPDLPLSALNIAQRQLVAIAKVLTTQPKIIIMDEPTASLTRNEVDYLLAAVARLKQQGITILFVSHRLAEVQAIAERVTVIRDGSLVTTRQAQGITTGQLSELMTGHVYTDKVRTPTRFDTPVLTTQSLSRRGEFDNIDLTIHQGEIVGLTGLLGSGRTELALSLFGITRPDQGKIILHRQTVDFKSNRDAIRAGIAYVSEDRLNLGLIQAQSIQDNTAITVLRQLDPSGFWLKPARISAHCRYWIERFQIKSHNQQLPVSSLSGGNQQRIVLGKWLATQPKLLILDAPTVGVDIGAKQGIFKAVAELAAEGLAILIISDEISEVYHHCDRVHIMHQGHLSAAYYPAHTTEAELEEKVYA